MISENGTEPTHPTFPELATDSLPSRGGEYMEDSGPGMSMPFDEYASYMKYVGLLADPVMAEVSEGLKYIVASAREMAYIMRLLPLATMQLTAECGWWEVEMDQDKARRRLLRNAIEDWDGIDPVDTDRLPLTRAEAVQELGRVEARIRDLHQKIATYKARGHYWSAKPLLEFMELAPEQRQGYAYDHLLPPLMRDVKQALYAAMPDGIGFANRQAVGANQVLDIWQPSNLERAVAAKNGMRVPRPTIGKMKGRDAV